MTGLENGRTYFFILRAGNAANGEWSDERSVAPRSLRPAAPAGLIARPGDAQLVLAWNDPEDPAISGWQYAVRTTGGFGAWTDIPGSDAMTTAHTATGLENGIEYFFKIRAVNEHGNGAESGQVSATPVAVPAKPTGLTAIPGDGRAALSWNDSGNTTVTGWQYSIATTGGYGGWTDIAGSDAGTTGHVVTGLDNGTAHRFKLRAVNNSGPGAESDEAMATPLAVPAKPTGFTATPGDGRAALAWDGPGDATITGWQYIFKTTGSYGSWIDIAGSDAATTAHTVTGLDNGAAHRFKLRAVNASGSGAESEEIPATPIAAPAKPTGLTAAPGDGRVALAWDASDDATISGWQYKVASTGAFGNWTDIPGSGATTTGHIVGGLDNGTAHRFKLRAVNVSGPGAESEEIAATPIAAPAKPTDFTATPGDGRVALAWDDPGNATVTGWQYALKITGDYGSWIDIPGSDATTTAHTVTELDNDAAYNFKLRAVNASGGGAESDEVTATPVAVPAKPAGFTATPGDNQVSLQWTDPDDSSITGWQYAVKTTGSYDSWTDIADSDATTTRHAVTGLNNGVAHRFKLRAVNSSGNGIESEEATATPVPPPAKPEGFEAAPLDGKVVLTWDDPGDVTIAGWQYKVASTGVYGPWTGIPGSGAATTGYTVMGLDNGIAYRLKLRAVNGSGDGAESDEAAATPIAVPAKPTGLTAASGDGRVALTWDDPDNMTIVHWQYRYDAGSGYGEWTDVPGSGATTTAHTVTGLDNGTTHRFKLRAVNGSGDGAESDEAAATPIAVPAKPTGLTAASGDGRVALTWDDPGNATVAGWQYAVKTTGSYGPWTDISGSDATTTAHTVTGLNNGIAHRFKLRAVNGSGEGAESDEAAATPIAVPAKPTGLTAAPGDGRVALAWDDPGNATVTGWQYALKTTGDYGSWIDIHGSDATTTAHTVTGLDNGTAHRFKLRAVNASGGGAESDEAAATPVAVPAKPTGFTATPGDRRIGLAWDDPGDTTIIRWQYRYDAGSGYGEWTDIPGSGPTTTSHEATGFDNGTLHRLRIRAVNNSGPGAESGEVATTPVPVPAKPAGFTATPGDERVALAWDRPDDATITGWQYALKTTGGYGSWIDIPGSSASTTGYTVTGLANGVVHRFRLRAVNASGNGAESDEATATPVAVPAKPTGFTAAPGDRRVALAWDDPGNATITGWQYALKTTGAYGPWIDIPDSGATTTAHNVTGLGNGTAHRFKLRAVNASGPGAESDVATATPVPVPAKPAGLSATAGDGQVSLQWTDPDDATITGWQYRYRTTGGYGDWTDIDSSGAETANHTVTKLANGVIHRFVVRAVNASGPGAPSGVAVATPLAVPAKPAGFAATAGAGKVVLSWDDPEDPAITGWAYNQRRGEGEFGEEWTHISNRYATGYTVPGLEIGATYGFKLRADNVSGPGAESDEIAVTLPPVPAKPAGLTAAAADRAVVLEWTALGDATVTGWQYRYRTTGSYGDWIEVPGSGAATTSRRVAGLEIGALHTFRVRAVNSSGPGLESDEAEVTPFAVPARPVGFTATAGNGEALLEWDDPGDDTITGYEYIQRKGNEEFEKDWTYILNSNAATIRHTVIGLDNGVAYAFKLRAVNAGGASQGSAVATATPAGVPARPQGFAVMPGEREVSLEWKALGDPTVTVWQYKYRTGSDDSDWTDIPGSGPDTTEYKVTGLKADVSHKFQIRAANSSGPGLASEEIATAPLGRPARPIGLTATPGYGQVALAWDGSNDPAIVRWQYVAGTELDTGIDEWVDIAGSGPRTTRYVVEALESGVAYIFQVRACASEDPDHPLCGPGSNVAYATPKAAATRTERKTVKAVLAGLAGRVAAGADAMIGARFSAGPAQSSVVLAGRKVPLFARDSKEQMRAPPGGAPKATVRGIGSWELLQDSSFQVAPGPPGGKGFPQWSLWHRGDLTRFEGSAGAGSRYGGRLLSAWYGVDMRWDGRWLAGAALARSKAEVDYAAGGGSGLLETVLDSVHPYLQRRFDEGGTVRVALGGGRGTARNESANRGVETAEIKLATVSVGFRAPLPAFRGLKLSTSGAAGFARFEADGDARTAIGSLSASTNRQSLGAEAALGDGDTAYRASLSLRRDGGDGANGIGLELTKGVETALPSLSGHAAVRTRWLVWNSDSEYREFGVAAAVRRPAGPNDRGFSWSLSVAQGTPDGAAGGPEAFWREDAPERGGGKDAFLLDLSAGWGLVSRGGALTPRAAFGLAGTNDRRLALELDIGPPSGPRLKLAARRRIPRAGTSENRITAAVQFRF